VLHQRSTCLGGDFSWTDSQPNQHFHEDIVGIEHFLQHGQQLKGKANQKTRFLIWLATVWNIWQLRNAIIFKGAVADFKNLKAKIQALS